MKKGLFVAFEGIDGSGKTTQIKKFVHYLFDKDKHNHVVFTRNPYKDVTIRGILREDSNPMARAELIADLYINDRFKQVEEIVVPFLEKGHFVVTDRFKISTLAYQGAQGLDVFDLLKRHEGLPKPDVTFVIDVPSAIAGERMGKDLSRENEQKFEKDLNFLENVRGRMVKIGEVLEDEKVFVIDGTRSEDEIFQEIVGIFEREFGKV